MLKEYKRIAGLYKEDGCDTYIYQFTKHTSDEEDTYRSPHSAELPYLFGTAGYGGAFPWFTSKWKQADYHMSSLIVAAWASFIKRDEMLLLNGKKWERYDGEKNNVMIFS